MEKGQGELAVVEAFFYSSIPVSYIHLYKHPPVSHYTVYIYSGRFCFHIQLTLRLCVPQKCKLPPHCRRTGWIDLSCVKKYVYGCSLYICNIFSGRLALKYDQLEAMDCLVATLSVDPVKSHEEWLRDVV
jgi:hypothetical protein